MRPIKFRAWDTEVEEMFDVARFDLGDYMIYPTAFPLDGRLAEDCVVMQYTGLADKNGNEIDEGDIINCINYEFDGDREYDQLLEVKYDGHYTGFYPFQDDYQRPDEFEVIGNICENADLLEGEE